MLKSLLSVLRRLSANSRGNTGIILSLAAIPLFGAAGVAIDYGRLHAARNNVQSALDAAVLAGTRTLMEKNSKTLAVQSAQTYFNNNLPANVELLNSTIAFNVNAAGNGVESTGNADMKTSFMSILNVPTMAIFPDAEAAGSAATMGVQGQGGNLEIALMLDVTGSMCDDGSGPCKTAAKLDGLKVAATTLIDTVVWADQTTYTSKVALVPFSSRIRLAPDDQSSPLTTKITGLPSTWSGWVEECISGYSTVGGSGEDGGGYVCTQTGIVYKSNEMLLPCLTERNYSSSGLDFTDDAPGPGRWLMANNGDRKPYFDDSSDAPLTTETGATQSDPSYNWNYDDALTCGGSESGNSILPLTNDTTALKDRISGLEGAGGTAGPLATAVTWYMLSPNWADIWGTESAPASYADLTQKNSNGAPKLRKIAVIMTDGLYNNMYGYSGHPAEDLSAYAIKYCDAMKAKGIEVFTVGFALDELSVSDRDLATKTLQSCGSGIDHFYNSLSIADLQGAFKAIGTKVAASSLRLTK